MNNHFGELLLMILLLLFVIICIPLCLGVLAAVALGATGFNYYAVVLCISMIIWIILGIAYYID